MATNDLVSPIKRNEKRRADGTPPCHTPGDSQDEPKHGSRERRREGSRQKGYRLESVERRENVCLGDKLADLTETVTDGLEQLADTLETNPQSFVAQCPGPLLALLERIMRGIGLLSRPGQPARNLPQRYCLSPIDNSPGSDSDADMTVESPCNLMSTVQSMSAIPPVSESQCRRIGRRRMGHPSASKNSKGRSSSKTQQKKKCQWCADMPKGPPDGGHCWAECTEFMDRIVGSANNQPGCAMYDENVVLQY